MHSFTDASGREWQLDINFAALQRIRDLTGLDLLGDSDALQGVLVDFFALVNATYALIKPAADIVGVSADDFGSSLDYEHVERLREAFWGELVNFFPPARRAKMASVLTTVTTTEKAFQAAADKVDLDLEFGNLLTDLGVSPE